ncbi:hypothetical protein ACM26V_18645 [Salipaludibacillus sp. HK11]|uniref:hypothetical protein n=1 Tax=Salipaludibacillus sp. HK11 TaxID=3394320 RepID=UPI0039FD659C
MTIQALINRLMNHIIVQKKYGKLDALNVIYKECHPCVTEVFSSSGDFLVRISAITDYTIQIVSKLQTCDFYRSLVLKDTYIFLGENQSQNEAWVFLSSATKEDPKFLIELREVLNETFTGSWACLIYCMEDGDMTKLFQFSQWK